MARRRKSTRRKRPGLNAKGKEMFKLTKLWFSMGGAIQAMAAAAAVANSYRALDLQDKAKQKITRRRGPIENPNEVTRRGTYRKSTVALPAPAPPRYYQPWSLNIIDTATPRSYETTSRARLPSLSSPSTSLVLSVAARTCLSPALTGIRSHTT